MRDGGIQFNGSSHGTHAEYQVTQEGRVRQGCTQAALQHRPSTEAQLADSVTIDPRRSAAILAGRTKWVNKTVLHYCFFAGNSHFSVPKAQADAIRQASATWKAAGVGLEFQEVKKLSEAEVRIGYSTADGRSASAVGRDVLNVPWMNRPPSMDGT